MLDVIKQFEPAHLFGVLIVEYCLEAVSEIVKFSMNYVKTRNGNQYRNSMTHDLNTMSNNIEKLTGNQENILVTQSECKVRLRHLEKEIDLLRKVKN